MIFERYMSPMLGGAILGASIFQELGAFVGACFGLLIARSIYHGKETKKSDGPKEQSQDVQEKERGEARQTQTRFGL